jgi:ribonuclease HII
VVAAVVFDVEHLTRKARADLAQLDDSKRMSAANRETLSRVILAHAEQVVIQSACAGSIDRYGLHRTNLRLLGRAVSRIHPAPDVALIDGFRLPEGAPIHRAIVRGDRTSASIAAASVIAKTVRDRLMRDLGRGVHPDYGFEIHVGYATRAHRLALASQGPCSLHRRSFQWTASDLGVDLVGEPNP